MSRLRARRAVPRLHRRWAMSSPRDRDPSGDPFQDRPDDGSGWQEPAHLGDGDAGSARIRGRRARARRDRASSGRACRASRALGAAGLGRLRRSRAAPDAGRAAPGWPPAGPDETRRRPTRSRAAACSAPAAARRPGALERVFAYEGDLVGAQGWALQNGWTVSDGTDPADAAAGRADRLGADAAAEQGRTGRPACCAAGTARWSWSPSTSSIASGAVRRAGVRGDGRADAGHRPAALGCPPRGSGSTASAGWCRSPAGTRPSTCAG